MKILISQKVKEYLKSNNYSRVRIARGKDRRISIFSEDEWNRQKNKLGLMFPEKREREQMLKILFIQSSVKVDLESNDYNEMNIPDELQKWAGIEGDIIIVGRANRIEVWSKENYSLYSKDKSGIALGSFNYKGE